MGRDFLKTAGNFLIFFAILFLFTKFAGPLPFSVNSVTTTKTTTFDVTAQGKASGVSNETTIQAGISATGNTISSVQEKINSTIQKISNSVKKLGVDAKDIQTANYSVYPIYNENQRITGYSANTTLSIKVKDVSKAGDIIDAATLSGATNVQNLGFSVSDTTGLENEARRDAVSKAKKKAQDAAKIAGFKLGRIVNYSENFAGSPVPLSAESKKIYKSTPTQLEPGQTEVTVTVTLSYEIE